MFAQNELNRVKRLRIALSKSHKRWLIHVTISHLPSPIVCKNRHRVDTHIPTLIRTIIYIGTVLSGGMKINISINTWHAFELNLYWFRQGKSQFLELFILFQEIYFATALQGFICLFCFRVRWVRHTMFYSSVKRCLREIGCPLNKLCQAINPTRYALGMYPNWLLLM